MLLFFVVSAFGTVMAGIFAPSALPLLGEVTAPANVEWGELRVAKVTSNIRAQANTSSQIVGTLAPGDSVRVEPAPGGWYEVYRVPLVRRSEAKPLGFVFGRLLVPAGVALASDAPRSSTGAEPEDDAPAETSRRSSGRGS
ncbi:MAG: SH3 domain-containing protein [Gemmatimonadales bacterium]